MASDDCASCGHSKSGHFETNGYQPYGHCNFQHDLCGCTEYVAPEGAAQADAPAERTVRFTCGCEAPVSHAIEQNWRCGTHTFAGVGSPSDPPTRARRRIERWECPVCGESLQLGAHEHGGVVVHAVLATYERTADPPKTQARVHYEGLLWRVEHGTGYLRRLAEAELAHMRDQGIEPPER
jgi:hypothetical protein